MLDLKFLDFPLIYYKIFSLSMIILCLVLLVLYLKTYFSKRKILREKDELQRICEFYEFNVILLLNNYVDSTHSLIKHFRGVNGTLLKGIFPLSRNLLNFAKEQNAQISKLKEELESVKTGKKYAQDFFKNKDKKDKLFTGLEDKEEKEKIEQKYLEYLNTFEGKNQLLDHSKIFAKKPMNGQEFIIYDQLIEREDLAKDFIISPQVSFKAFIDKEDKESEVWRSYANLVADFLFIDKENKEPVAILEFLGSGHYGINNEETKEEREEKEQRIRNNDSLKEKICDKAGLRIFFLEGKDIYKENNYIDYKLLKDKLDEIAGVLLD